MKTFERPIDSVFVTSLGDNLQVVEDKGIESCEGCFWHDPELNGCNDYFLESGYCSKDYRKDEKDVSFELIIE